MSLAQAVLEISAVTCVLAPVAGFALLGLAGIISAKPSESFVAGLSRIAAAVQLVAAVALVMVMYERGFVPAHSVSLPGFPLFVDWPALAYMLLTGFTGWIVVSYSERYMHREPGFLRFFMCLMVFLSGMSLIILGGALDTLFIGWEIVGLASFLLVGFYPERVKAARHALRAFMTYRLCDVGLLVGAILTHVIYHSGSFESIEGERAASISTHGASPLMVLSLSLLIFLAASGKSAQFPFSGWLSRAMEGPTPSTAVFYGSLSIHAGVYLLVRTEDIWCQSTLARCVLFAAGAFSAFQARLVSTAQSTTKGRIAWASISHVGVMFCEMALGWHVIAVGHACMHAVFRCYQLLLSPSAVALHFRDQQPFRARHFVVRDGNRLARPVYMLAMNEFYVDLFFNRMVTSRFRKFSARSISRAGTWLKRPITWLAFLLMMAGSIYAAGHGLGGFQQSSVWLTLIAISIPSMLLVNRGAGDPASARHIWLAGLGSLGFSLVSGGILVSELPAFNSLLRPFFSLACLSAATCLGLLLGDMARPVAWRMNLGFQALGLLLLSAFWLCGEGQIKSCVMVLAGLGAGIWFVNLALGFMFQQRGNQPVSGFNGLAVSFPRAAQIFLLGSLALVTFPFTSAFRGEDLILEAAYTIHPLCTVFGGLVAILIQLMIIKALAHGYMGQPRHEVRHPQLDFSKTEFFAMSAALIVVFGGTMALL